MQINKQRNNAFGKRVYSKLETTDFHSRFIKSLTFLGRTTSIEISENILFAHGGYLNNQLNLTMNNHNFLSLLYPFRSFVSFLRSPIYGFPPQWPGFKPESGQVEFVVDKVALGRFSPSTSVSPANLHSTKFSIIIITRSRYNRPIGGRRAEWTQLNSTPPLCELKKNSPIYTLHPLSHTHHSHLL
jgi:hypothetical protein